MTASSLRRPVVLFAVGALAASLTLLLGAARALAAERIYWDNYGDSPATIGFSNLDGTAGGSLNLTGAEVKSPEGMAYDSATGRIYVAASSSGENGQIIWVNVDGSGAGVFSAPGAPIEEPEGIAVDPASRKLYWVNTEGNGEAEGSIAWANLDGSAGGMLNTTGATLQNPYRLAIDPASGRLFWTNFPGPGESLISYASLDNGGGGGDLDITGATSASNDGLAVDSAAGRLYWLGDTQVSYASVNGGGGGDLELAGATYASPYGMAVDPSLGKLYWGNYEVNTGEPNGIGTESTSGSDGGALSPVGAPVNGPQDPIVLKSPTGTAAPEVTRSKGSRSTLLCSAGEWAADYAGGFVYQAPQSYAYQWSKNGTPISGATATTLKAKSAAEYSCTVTANNPQGAAAQTSAKRNVKAAKLKLSTKKKAKAKAGKLATFKLKALNQGDLKSGSARVCVKLAGAAKKALKRPKCKTLGKLAGGKRKSTKVKLRVKGSAGPGTYKLTFQVKGAKGKATKAKVVVIG